MAVLSSVIWQVKDGILDRSYTLAGTPPIWVVPITVTNSEENGNFYVFEIPLETVQVRDSTGEPQRLELSNQALERPAPGAAPSSLILTPLINGQAAIILRINGVAPASAMTSLTVDKATLAGPGRRMRVDLQLTRPAGGYTEWAAQYFTDPAVAAAQPAADPDGDGMSNEQERLAGTHPRDSASVFLITGLQSTGADGALTLTWHSVPGKTYRIETSATLAENSWHPVATVSALGSQSSRPLPAPAGGGACFYRVRVVP